MKKRLRVRGILWGILLITVSSCIESDRIMHYAQFEHTINLKSDRIQVPSVLLYPRSLVLCDSNLRKNGYYVSMLPFAGFDFSI